MKRINGKTGKTTVRNIRENMQDLFFLYGEGERGKRAMTNWRPFLSAREFKHAPSRPLSGLDPRKGGLAGLVFLSDTIQPLGNLLKQICCSKVFAPSKHGSTPSSLSCCF